MTTDPGTAGEIPLGRRVVLRYRLPPGYTHPMTDVIGELISLDPPTVRAADGQTVQVAADQVVALKALGPRPIRTKEIRSLETAAAYGWPGIEQEWVDGWLLRAGDGYTKRANSALPLGTSSTEPASRTPETLARIEQWYARRGRWAELSLPDRLAAVPPGWTAHSEVAVLAMDIANFVLPQGPSMVRVHAAPDPAWLRMHRFRGEEPAIRADSGSDPNAAVITSVHEGELGFAALGLPQPIAIGRGALTTAPDGLRWIGLSCVAVAAAHRRHGLGSLVCAELIRWGHERGATHAYLQVTADNAAAMALYREMGFLDHHGYRYAVPAAASA